MRPMIRILESNQIIDLSANRSFNIEMYRAINPRNSFLLLL